MQVHNGAGIACHRRDHTGHANAEQLTWIAMRRHYDSP
jgi:hypothetical protein